MKPPHVQRIMAALARLRNRYTSEAALQRAILMHLDHAAIAYTREHSLTKNERIDFHVEGPPAVGIEVKMAGGEMEHLRQLYRYAPHYDDLVLVTTQASRPEDQTLTVFPERNPPDFPGLTDAQKKGRACRLHVLNISLRI